MSFAREEADEMGLKLGDRITVNFEHAGKVAIDGKVVQLTLESLDHF
jgi:predicted lysophospholipase L1 biosynthesis ABC-type transport system permease subunit